MKQRITIGMIIEAIKRFWHIVLCASILGLIGGTICFSAMKSTSFISSSTITKTTSFGKSNYSNLNVLIHTSSYVDAISTNLKNKHISHEDGTTISNIEIENGLSFSDYDANYITSYVKMYFRTTYSGVSQYVLREASNILVSVLSSYDEFNGISIFETASDIYVEQKSNILMIPVFFIGSFSFASLLTTYVLWAGDRIWNDQDELLKGIKTITFRNKDQFLESLGRQPDALSIRAVVDLTVQAKGNNLSFDGYNVSKFDQNNIALMGEREQGTILIICERYKTKRSDVFLTIRCVGQKAVHSECTVILIK